MTNFNDISYSISEAAAKLDLSEKTLRRWEDAGRFTPSRTLGNQRRYSLEDLQILDAIKHNVIPHQKDLLTKELAAQLLGVTPVTLDRYVAEGSLHPFITVGTTYYPRHRLLPLLSELKAHPPSSPPDPTPLPSVDPLPSSAMPNPPVAPLSPPLPSTPLAVPAFSSFTPHAPYLIQLALTLTLLTAYHYFFNPPSVDPLPLSPDQVQGAATNPSLRLLDDMLDPSTGGLTATTLSSKFGTTTPNLTLLPTIAPTNPSAGNLYYDAGENVLKVYADGSWQALTTLPQLDSLRFDLESKLATPASTTP